MKEFIEKLIGRLEELKTEALDKWDGGASHRAYSKAIDIANELAEEYNNGWIPCSERLPSESQNVIVCFAHGLVTELAFYDGLFHGIYDYNTKVIIAWMPLPEPYQQTNERSE